MRIYNYVTEREVQQNIGLRDETLRVQCRPDNRNVQIDPNLFKERSYEMVEMDEIAKVSKTARVVEEVSLGKEVSEKVETIKETLRRQDVKIEQVPAVRPLKDYESDFKGFYTKNLGNSGVTYEKLSPAFHYGYDLATREPFRSSSLGPEQSGHQVRLGESACGAVVLPAGCNWSALDEKHR